MKLRVLGLTALVLPLCACSGASGQEPGAPPAAVTQPAPPSPQVASSYMDAVATDDPAVANPALAGRTLTRTIEKDPDNDGIANSRVIITDTFDESGRLAARTREIDRDADGIIDSKTVTEFGAAGGPAN